MPKISKQRRRSTPSKQHQTHKKKVMCLFPYSVIVVNSAQQGLAPAPTKNHSSPEFTTREFRMCSPAKRRERFCVRRMRVVFIVQIFTGCFQVGRSVTYRVQGTDHGDEPWLERALVPMDTASTSRMSGWRRAQATTKGALSRTMVVSVEYLCRALSTYIVKNQRTYP